MRSIDLDPQVGVEHPRVGLDLGRRRPSAMQRPKSSTTTRSQTAITRSMWCSTSSTASRPERADAARRARPCRPRPSPPAGSSSSSSRGRRRARGRARPASACRRAGCPGAGRRRRRRRASSSAASASSRSRALGAVRAREPEQRARPAPGPRLGSAPTITFSTAVSPANSPTPCSVRAIPSRASSCGRARSSARAAEAHAAGVGADEAADDVEQRRLARAVGADDADDLARRDRQRDVVEGGQPAEANA